MSMVVDFGASWCSNAAAMIICHPIDTMRVRYQTRGHHPLDILLKEPTRALYAGVSTPLILGGPVHACIFMTNDFIKRVLVEYPFFHDKSNPIPQNNNSSKSHHLHHRLSFGALVLAGALSGGIGSILVCPMGTIKLQQQIRGSTIRSKDGCTSTTPAYGTSLRPNVIISELVKAEGISGLYRAFQLEMAAGMLGRACYFGSYEMLKRKLAVLYHSYLTTSPPSSQPIPSPHELEIRTPVRVAAAAITSIFSWFVIYPCDTVRGKIQSQNPSSVNAKVVIDNSSSNGLKQPLTSTTLPTHRYAIRMCIRQTYRDGGVRAFFAGYPLIALRGSLTAMINLPLYEYLREVLH
eukprot:Tbor_TRINITY_DN5056_c0_g1::TRINITY_DN5056_c0_g1_i1::g.14201::m.14201/K15109/SLC25A20_29, CACT, CACL, CRC1; solute carrier family 25 (mitochondrial carnitine/acylcarnitine transporter), member 20/29